MPALTEAETWAAERKRVAARKARRADREPASLGDLLILAAAVAMAAAPVLLHAVWP